MEPITRRFHKEVFQPYIDFLTTSYRFHSVFADVQRIWEQKLSESELVKGPYLEKAQAYKEGVPLDELPLHETTKAIVMKQLAGKNLWRHQTDALSQILNDRNVVVATGTSSGKTLCYQIPILNDLICDSTKGLRAIIIYPLNALVNDQLTAWEKLLLDQPSIRFARFTGQTPDNQEVYRKRLQTTIEKSLKDKGLSEEQQQRELVRSLEAQLKNDPPNRLNHRDAIRSHPPHILITNFSMLEYLLERPIDAPIFDNSRLKFLVLDEVHAYRGVQATEIAFLIRRIKDRLKVDKLLSIATSATLGKQDDPKSQNKVRQFATDLFDSEFLEPNPIYGTQAEPKLLEPSFRPTPAQYVEVAQQIRNSTKPDFATLFAGAPKESSLQVLLHHDENLYRLRKEILVEPILLKDAAQKLWPNILNAEEGLQSLLDVIAAARTDETIDDLLPARLHYFVRAQDGLHGCFHLGCPARVNGKPAYFVSRNNGPEVTEGDCPECSQVNRKSKLVEIVSCRKCGYLYGALQDLGPRRAQSPDSGESNVQFDSFTTELGAASDSFWTYFSIEGDLPYPSLVIEDEADDESDDLLLSPNNVRWCAECGKKHSKGEGEYCNCAEPHLRTINIFHRQCPTTGKPKDRDNLFKPEKSPLLKCPNCGTQNSSGIEPVHRFQESDDEMGLAMAIPLSHFDVSGSNSSTSVVRKLLCFTDHRQRAAAFPSLLEEETFTHDLGRMINRVVANETAPITLETLGILLTEIAAKNLNFFLPTSRLPDDGTEPPAKNLWTAESFAYFGVPDSARESVEDFGLVAVEYMLKQEELSRISRLFVKYTSNSQVISAVTQTLFAFMRQRKAFTLPKGRVDVNDAAFGRVTAEISYALVKEGKKNTNGWLPTPKKDKTYGRSTVITDYLQRTFKCSSDDAINLAKNIWNFLTTEEVLLYKTRDGWQLYHQRLLVGKPRDRFVCSLCRTVTSYSANNCCPRKGCDGNLASKPFDPRTENIVARWIAEFGEPQFSTLRSEEHTAQIEKTLAKTIEDQFRTDKGVNLLSSTTTFEMGINIGDLQKVLLRNAPPSSANYVQRVGRAGRGKDKNSVSVTLCRRTRYDADAWDNPPRLMSGEVRTPTVFIQNEVVSQRHFNAALFAEFLKRRIADTNSIPNLKQQIRLEGFLPVSARAGIHESFFQLKPANQYFNFAGWLGELPDSALLTTLSGKSLVNSVGGFERGKNEAIEKYNLVTKNIAEELMALVEERSRLTGELNEWKKTRDTEEAIKNLLGEDVIAILAKRGFLPRYAFPLDVVSLETGKTRWSRDVEVELSRDRGIAISEFAPASQVIARKKVFTSAGLYIVSKNDRPEPLWYSKCPDCEQIRTQQIKDQLIGQCEVCGRIMTEQFIHQFVEPSAFSTNVEDKNSVIRYRRSTLVRQRQSITHFIDHVDEKSFQPFRYFRLFLKKDGALFRYNMGPESKGFVLCPECGFSEPVRGSRPGRGHQPLRQFGSKKECFNDQPWRSIAYGHRFRSYCLIARPLYRTDSLESLAYALQRGVCSVLDLDSSDIGVSTRWLADSGGNQSPEIVLYDNTPGGAGFVRDGSENWEEVENYANSLCLDCICENSCYDCLKSYSNQSQHDRLDRNTVVRYFATK